MNNINLEKLVFEVPDEWKEFEKANPHALFIPEIAKAGKEQYLRKKGTDRIYLIKGITKENIFLSCLNCNSDLSLEIVRHKTPLKGAETVYYEFIPYCPNCEKKPSQDRGY